jgi:uncharacterized protein YndB with AHSA1/START domain
MLPKAEFASFVIADISGYTGFLAGVELEHAHDIIADVMDTVVRCLRPPFRLAKFEGDAAFLYAVSDKVDGSLLQDAIESAYFAFRKRLRNIEQATSCECSACRKMQDLDLKFVSHHGEFIRHRMAGREELAGRDVIVIHRLLKNAVNERLGGHAYALYSDACVQAMGIDPATQGLVEHGESIDVIGDVKCWVRDLEAAWKTESDRRRSEVTRDNAAMVIEFDIAAPRPTVWEYFVVPGQRPKWRGADEVREMPKGGRRGVGTVNHCMHGDHAIIEEVIDWRPFDYLTLTTLLPMPGAPKVLMSYAFSETADDGTHIEIRVAKPKPKDKAFLEQVGPEFQKNITREVATLRQMIETPKDAAEDVEKPV